MAGIPIDNSITTRFYQTLNSPIQYRCGELTVLFDRSSSKDLQNIYPVLIDSIFGSSCSVGWGIRSITPESHPREFEILHHFLSPLGPVFRLIYKLLGESHLRYDYPLTQVPTKILLNLENGRIPPFYSDLLHHDLQTKKLISLRLNPFDFYMMHFAWHLISPWQQRTCKGQIISAMAQWGTWNTVYYMLSCDYLIHFLPTDPNSPVLPHVPSHFTGKNPIVTHLQTSNRSLHTSTIFRAQVLQQAEVELNTLHQADQHPRNEIWRSETVVQIFIDLWLNNDLFNQSVSPGFEHQAKMNEIPSGEYIRIIRVMVKQLHAFSASGKIDPTILGELKKIVMPMFQGKIYGFLRHLIHRWPLDGSFRLVLELWLSFIQPWRYPGDEHLRNQNDQKESDEPNILPAKAVDREYMQFMAHNLLSYTVIFQQLLPRFLRVDLVSPKNAVMLYRVTKVFSQPNLVYMLEEIESCIDNLNHSPSHSYSSVWTSNLPPLSPTAVWSTNHSNVHSNSNMNSNYSQMDNNESVLTPRKNSPIRSNSMDLDSPLKETLNRSITGRWTGIVRQQIFELEGPEFYYKPLFTSQPAPEVIHLMRCLQQANLIAKEIVKEREKVFKIQHKGIVGFFKSVFSIPDDVEDEFSLEDRRKVPIYLELSQQNLSNIFKLDQSHLINLTSNMNFMSDSMFSYMPPYRVNEQLTNNRNSVPNLSPSLVKKQANNIHFEGDPDLAPVFTTENGFLLHILYHISCKINEYYGETIRIAYHRNDFYGRVARQFISPPILVKSYDKSIPGMPRRVEKLLPPRISLRPLANYKFITYIIFAIIITKFLGYNTVALFCTVLLIWTSIIFIKALTGESFCLRNSEPEVLTRLDESMDTSF